MRVAGGRHASCERLLLADRRRAHANCTPYVGRRANGKKGAKKGHDKSLGKLTKEERKCVGGHAWHGGAMCGGPCELRGGRHASCGSGRPWVATLAVPPLAIWGPWVATLALPPARGPVAALVLGAVGVARLRCEGRGGRAAPGRPPRGALVG
jgi:hypothetical protein